MTTRTVWDERIGILCAAGIQMPLRGQLADLPLDPDTMRVIVRAAVKAGRSEQEIGEAVRAMIDEHAPTAASSERPDAPGAEHGGPGHDGAEVPADARADLGAQPNDAATSGATPGKAKAVKPGTDDKRKGGRIEAGTKRRKSRTMKTKGAKSMNAVRKKTKKVLDSPDGPRLKLVPEDVDSDPKLNGRGPARPARTADVRPRLIDAASAAKLCGVSKSGWWAFHASGRCPLPIRLGRATRWRQDELSDWIDAGCPARVKWTWKPGRHR